MSERVVLCKEKFYLFFAQIKAFLSATITHVKECFNEGGKLFESVWLLFPVCVTLTTALTFLWGGRITPFQWWGCLLGALGFIFFWGKYSLRSRITIGVGLLLLLAILWVWAGVIFVKVWTDFSYYHYPAIRLLIEGWNPIYDATPEAIATTMGVSTEEMRVWHVLSMPKAVWYFSAASYPFFKTPFNLLFPLFPFILLSTAISILRFANLSKKWIVVILGLLTLSLTYCTSEVYPFTVDAYAGLAAIGLLVTMGDVLRGRHEGRTLHLLVYSFWMMNSKQSGLLGCFIFWVIFSAILLWQTRTTWRITFGKLAIAAGILLGMFLINSASPYFTQWVNYGHPLYPCYSSDEAKSPIRNIVWDFYDQNDDCKAMGHIGYFVNAYINPQWASHYYCKTLDKKEFKPKQRTWRFKTSPHSPITQPVRTLFLISTLFVFLFGSNLKRLLVGMVWITLTLVPTPMLGYLRYVPWGCALVVFASLTAISMRRGFCKVIVLGTMSYLLLQDASAKIQQELRRIDDTYVVKQYLTAYPLKEVFYVPTMYTTVEMALSNGMGDFLKISRSNIELLKRESSFFQNVEIQLLPRNANKKQFYQLYDLSLYVPKGTTKMEKSLRTDVNNCMKGNLFNYPKVANEILFKRLPKLIRSRLEELFE